MMKKLITKKDLEFVIRIVQTAKRDIRTMVALHNDLVVKEVEFTEKAEMREILEEVESGIDRWLESDRGKLSLSLKELGFK